MAVGDFKKRHRDKASQRAQSERATTLSRGGILVGSIVTALGVVVLAFGGVDRLNNYGLDLHFRHLSTIEADPRIVLVDINDHAIEAVGDWPWPRRRYAQLVSVLHELGAKSIVLDLVLSDTSPPRIEHAAPSEQYPIDAQTAPFGDPVHGSWIYDDVELRDAMTAAGSVYVGMMFRLSPPDVDPATVFDASLELVKQDPAISSTDFRNSLALATPSAERIFDPGSLYYRSRLLAALADNFGLDTQELARQLGAENPIDARTVERFLSAAKRTAARLKARAYLTERPHAEWVEFFGHVLPEASLEVETPDKNDLRDAFRFERSHRALAAANPPVPDFLNGRVAHAYDLTLPLDEFAVAAKGIGFVSFPREQTGGVVRDIPLLAETDGRLLFQLGSLVGFDELGVDRSAINFFPLDADGSSLLMWHVPPGIARWQDSFTHLPAARVLEVALNREAAAENERHFALAKAELVKLRHTETHAEYADYVRLVRRYHAAIAQTPASTSQDAQQNRAKDLEQIHAAIAEVENDAVLWLKRVHELWETTEPVSEAERGERAKIRRLYNKFGQGQLAAEIDTLNSNLTARTESLLEELRPQLAGKICFVGYTASGVADLVTSPVYASMPGVMAHANITNMVLQDKAAQRATTLLNGLLMLAVGLIVAGMASARGPIVSLASLMVVAAAVVGISAYLFWSSALLLGSPGIVAQACGTWAFVTAYRQFAEERSRRRFQRALAQYTSPAVAARIAGRANARDLSPVPATVTCFFSDLQSFTKLSERLGPERTRVVLNPYLQRMSQLLVEHEALVNKFMGDGIFAFFNAPIWPCLNHGERACACALASLPALAKLNREFAATTGREPLVMRIGLATGEAFVGDYGSDTKLDYTCIGDTVNLASRLEQACKPLGTSILVDGATKQQAGDRFAFRSLGRIALPGRRAAVDAHELLGLHDALDRQALEYASQFESVIRHYQACEWDICLEQIERCRSSSDHDDEALILYRRSVNHYRANPPSQDWDAAIALLHTPGPGAEATSQH